MKKVQINRILKGIKLAVEVLNLRDDILFAESVEEVKDIEKKIKATTKKSLDNYLTKVGYDTTIVDKSLLALNLQAQSIEVTIFNRNEDVIFNAIDVREI